MVLALNSLVFLLANGDVQRSGTNTASSITFLLSGRAVHRRPLTLADVHELVQQDGIFTVEINVFLYKNWLFVNNL